MKLIIAGGRDFKDFNLLEIEVKKFIIESQIKNRNEVMIISGKAIGADQLGERFASKFGFSLLEFPADWDKHGKSAGPIRNAEMAKNASHCIVFWDGESRGSANMIENCKNLNLVHKVIRY